MYLIKQADNVILEQDKETIKKEIINTLLDKLWINHINYTGIFNGDLIYDITQYIKRNNNIIQSYIQQYNNSLTLKRIIANTIYENKQFILDMLNQVANKDLLSFNNTYLNLDNSLNEKGLELKQKLIDAIEYFIDYNVLEYIDINKISIDNIITAFHEEYNTDTLIDLFFINPTDFNMSLNDEVHEFAKNIINDYIINNYSNIVIKLHEKDTDKKYIYGKLLLNYLYDNLNSILPQIKFTQHNNGTYEFSWLDTDKGSREDANLVFDYIGKNNEFKQAFFNANNISINDLTISWPVFVQFVKETLYNEALQLKVRDYIVDLNENILNERSKKLIESNTATGSTYDIDFDPENDHERSKPIVVAKEFLENGNTKNHVFFGEKGWNHGSVIRKYSGFLNTKCLNELKNPVIACAYLVGRVAFADPDRMYNGFDTIDEVIDTLKHDPNIEKVYNLPPDRHGGKITRLAKKWLL